MSGKSRSIKRNVEKKFYLTMLASHEKKIAVMDEVLDNISELLVYAKLLTKEQLDSAVSQAIDKVYGEEPTPVAAPGGADVSSEVKGEIVA